MTHPVEALANPLSPVDTVTNVSRRDFLANAAQALMGVTIIGTVVPLISSCSNSSSSSGASHGTATVSVASLTTDNASLVSNDLKPEGSPVLIVRKSATTYLAVSMHCQHQGCTVNAPSGGKINCPCHGSQYDLSGNLLQGPSTKGLSTYSTVYDATSKNVTITY